MHFIKKCFPALIALITCPVALAQVDCDALANAAEISGKIIPDFDSGRDILERGRLQFYSAPDPRCKIDGLFVIPGDTLFAHIEHNGFTKVSFIAMRKTDRKDVIGWVSSVRLRENGKGIVPGTHSL